MFVKAFEVKAKTTVVEDKKRHPFFIPLYEWIFSHHCSTDQEVEMVYCPNLQMRKLGIEFGRQGC